MTKNELHFDQIYSLIATTTNFIPEPNSPRTCRFCNRDEQATTFNNVAHAFPEFLGANQVIIWTECDECNKGFSKYESHLSKFFQPYITINGIKGKNGVPTFQSRSVDGDPQTHTLFSFEELNRLALTIGSQDDYSIDEETKTFSINFRIPKHKPLFVFKALVKIALSLLPTDKVTTYQSLFDWLKGRIENPHICYQVIITTMKKKRFKYSSGDLYEIKSKVNHMDLVPELTLVLKFGNIITQIFLPFTPEYIEQAAPGQDLSINLSNDHLLFNDFKKVVHTGKINYSFKPFDLSSPDAVTYDELMKFTYQILEKGSAD